MADQVIAGINSAEQINQATLHWIGLAYKPGFKHRPARAELAERMKTVELGRGVSAVLYLQERYKEMQEEGSVKSKLAQDIAKVLTQAGLPLTPQWPGKEVATFANHQRAQAAYSAPEPE